MRVRHRAAVKRVCRAPNFGHRYQKWNQNPRRKELSLALFFSIFRTDLNITHLFKCTNECLYGLSLSCNSWSLCVLQIYYNCIFISLITLFNHAAAAVVAVVACRWAALTTVDLITRCLRVQIALAPPIHFWEYRKSMLSMLLSAPFYSRPD